MNNEVPKESQGFNYICTSDADAISTFSCEEFFLDGEGHWWRSSGLRGRVWQ